MKVLAKFYFDCGRNGDLSGLFIEEKENIDAAVGKTVCFGEVLGKHSDVAGVLEDGDITIISEDQDFIAACETIIGGTDLCGYNPLDYLREEEEEE